MRLSRIIVIILGLVVSGMIVSDAIATGGYYVWFDDLTNTTNPLPIGTNRSGLGDDTNPGQGGDNNNSNNTGSDNPGNGN